MISFLSLWRCDAHFLYHDLNAENILDRYLSPVCHLDHPSDRVDALDLAGDGLVATAVLSLIRNKVGDGHRWSAGKQFLKVLQFCVDARDLALIKFDALVCQPTCFRDGSVVAGQGACTNSSFADQYELGGAYAPICDFDLLMAAVESARELGVKMPVGNLYSSDTFYDAAGRNMRYAKMGVMAVEMEAAALYCNAAYTGKRALAICSISDNLITGEELSADDRQTTFTNMMKIGLEIAVKMAAK